MKRNRPTLKHFRHELKFYIGFLEYENLRRRLGYVLKPDRNADRYGNYHIRSLYFDDEGNTALFEKQAGILSREKFRIRIYNHSDSIIKLEKKSRVGAFVHKTSEPLLREQYELILKKDFGFLRDSEKVLFNEFYVALASISFKPKVIVDYIREAYVSRIGNVRITFDNKLRSGLLNIDLFNSQIPTVNVIDEEKLILEIKYDNFLPDHIKALLQISSHERYAISKYVICRKFCKTNSWEDN